MKYLVVSLYSGILESIDGFDSEEEAKDFLRMWVLLNGFRMDRDAIFIFSRDEDSNVYLKSYTYDPEEED